MLWEKNGVETASEKVFLSLPLIFYAGAKRVITVMFKSMKLSLTFVVGYNFPSEKAK